MIPTDKLLSALNKSARNLLAKNVGYASDEQAILAVLNMLEAREVNGDQLFVSWGSRLKNELTGILRDLNLSNTAPHLEREIHALREILSDRRLSDLESRDKAEIEIQKLWAGLASRLVAEPRLDAAARIEALKRIAKLDKQHMQDIMGANLAKEPVDETGIDAEKLQHYLSDRFDEADIKVTAFKPLSGGYGKETILFEVKGNALNGDFVMRRDRSIPTLDNDCHRIELEHQVIRAVFEQGFPAPESLWLDTKHSLLPGGHFLIMRRAPGQSGGSVFGAEGEISPDLAKLLAVTMARLHNLPPLRNLGRISEGISPELWDLSFREVTKQYICSLRNMYLSEMPMPTPAVLSLFSWLLDNLPDASGRPVLLHGDIGFHNFVVHEGRLSALVDWEFAHIGDPAEDLGYVINTTSTSLDWEDFVKEYYAAGGPRVDEHRLRFFRVWGHLRNAVASELTSNCFAEGKLDNLKLSHVGYSMMPDYLEAIGKILSEPLN